jgi:hypothetical protein
MFNTHPAGTTEFKEGDNVVVLADGMYQSTLGVFARLRQDVRWAEIREPSGAMRCHPVVWLQHAECPTQPSPVMRDTSKKAWCCPGQEPQDKAGSPPAIGSSIRRQRGEIADEPLLAEKAVTAWEDEGGAPRHMSGRLAA